jgi:hypothetical protein
MPFALTVAHLKDALKEPGCPICRLAHEAAENSTASFLWENVNDPALRQDILAAYGFCPEHTRLLVAKELMESATVLGVNIIFEHLGRAVSTQLQAVKLKEQWTGDLWKLLGMGGSSPQILAPSRICPICASSQQSALNVLSDLLAELGRGTEDIRSSYLASDGVCLAHLRLGFKHFGRQFPASIKMVIDTAAERLALQAKQMQGYVRKSNWEYREEKMTPEESEAWRKTLTFFTGLPGDQFHHKVEKF